MPTPAGGPRGSGGGAQAWCGRDWRLACPGHLSSPGGGTAHRVSPWASFPAVPSPAWQHHTPGDTRPPGGALCSSPGDHGRAQALGWLHRVPSHGAELAPGQVSRAHVWLLEKQREPRLWGQGSPGCEASVAEYSTETRGSLSGLKSRWGWGGGGGEISCTRTHTHVLQGRRELGDTREPSFLCFLRLSSPLGPSARSRAPQVAEGRPLGHCRQCPALGLWAPALVFPQ